MVYKRLLFLLFLISLLVTPLAAFAQDATAEAMPDAAAETADADAAPTQSAGANGLLMGLWHLHAWTRWLVVLVGVAALVKLLLGLFGNAEYDSLTSRLMMIFSMLLSLQWVIGLVFFIVFGVFTRYQWEHLVVMTVAVALSHMHNRWKNADSRTRYRNGLILLIVVLVLIGVGVALLPQGWRIAPA